MQAFQARVCMELQLIPQPQMKMWLTSCLMQVLKVRNRMVTKERGGFLIKNGWTILTLKSTGTSSTSSPSRKMSCQVS